MNDELRKALDDFYAAQAATPAETSEPGSSLRGNQEKLSDALAVHPKQVKAMEADAKRKGVPTEFHPDGRPVIRSRAHQKDYIKLYGFHNNDGGYGD